MKITRRTLLKMMAAIPFLQGLNSCSNESNPESTPLSTQTVTLKPRAYWKSNQVTPIDIELFKKKGYGILDEAEGEPHQQLLQRVGDDYTVSSFYRRTLIMFPHITDIHITDIEAPVRALYGLVTVGEMSAYRSNSIYAAHILDCMLQTINFFHKKHRMDFLLMTGDAIDNAELVELQWFNTLMNGGDVKIDSGTENDPVPGPHNDFTDQFKAKGLNHDLPWYSAIGNHDVLYVGIHLIDDNLISKYTGSNILKTDIGEPIYAGTQNATKRYGDPEYAFQRVVKEDGVSLTYLSVDEGKELFGSEALTTPEDPRRTPFNTHAAFQEAIKDVQSYPIQEDEKSCYYFFRPNAGVPIEFIVLDTSASLSDFQEKDGTLNPGKQNSDGFLDAKQFEWLKERLEYLSTEGYGAVIAHHHPTYAFDDNSKISAERYHSLLKSYSNILVVIVGHGHRNNIAYYPPNEGEYGFHEIQTSGLLDFPEQCRLFEFVYNGDGCLSIFSTMIDHHSEKESMADFGRSLSLCHLQCWSQERVDEALGNLTDRNVEIVVPLPPRVRARFDQLSGFSSNIRSLNLDG